MERQAKLVVCTSDGMVPGEDKGQQPHWEGVRHGSIRSWCGWKSKTMLGRSQIPEQ